MSSNFPFDSDSPYSEFLRRQRAQDDIVSKIFGPTAELHRQLAMDDPLGQMRALEKTGILATAARIRGSELANTLTAAEAFRRSVAPALAEFATPRWMIALQNTARAVSWNDNGILAAQKQLGSMASEWTKMGQIFGSNQATIGALMRATQWSEQFKALSERIAPSIELVRVAAERARAIDALTLRATAETVARSSVAVAAEQVLEAHRLIEAIGQAQSPEQSANLFATLVSLMASLFQRFGENTIKELSGIGAIRLLELFLVMVGLVQWLAPPDMSMDEQKVVAEMKAEVEMLEQRIGKLLTAHEKANEAYIAGLPRAELKRTAPIRRDPQGKGPVLMRGDAGMLLAIKESRGKWRLIVYRDPLSEQLSEGWVYAPAVRLLEAPSAR